MSDEKIDHAAEAQRLAQLVDLTYGRIEHSNGAWAVSQGVEAQMMAQVAQVHATLALVEQQRIANLIALNGMASELGYATGAELGDEVAGLLADAEIRKGLGL